MATVCRKLRRGNTNIMNQFTGESNEITSDTDKKVVVIHDGVTPGGVPGAREDLTTTSKAAITSKGIMDNKFENADFTVLDGKYAKVDASNLDISKLFEQNVAKADATNIVSATQTLRGVMRVATVSEAIAGTAADLAITPLTLKSAVSSATRIFSPMFINGLDLHYSDASTVTIDKGYCRSQNDSINFNIDVPITLGIQSQIPNTTYHAFIGQNSSGQTLVQFFTSLTPQEFINNGYLNYRRVGSVITDSSGAIIPFSKIGPFFQYITPIVCTTTKLPVPSGIDLEIQTDTRYFHANTNRQSTDSITIEGYCDRREYF